MAFFKICKALGLDYRGDQGNFWRVNDQRLDTIWAKMGELNISIEPKQSISTSF